MKESFKPVLQSIPILLEFIERQMLDAGLSAKTAMQMCLAVEEIATNIIYHGHLAPEDSINVVYTNEAETITICISDQGLPFNPLLAEAPDIHASLEEREVGGLGLFFVKQVVDRIDYKRADDRNCIYLTKNK